MFGKNEVAKRQVVTEGKPIVYGLQELFYTIQGEGPFAGQTALFLRLAGCNLRCFFCDTDFSSKRTITLEGLLADCAASIARAKVIVITGGEPMLQEIGFLILELWERHSIPIQIETAGTAWPDSFELPRIKRLLLEGDLTLVCSPKTPKVHPRVAQHCRHWKYIVGSTMKLSSYDGLPDGSTQVAGEFKLIYRPMMKKRDVIWVQPQAEYKLDSQGEMVSDEPMTSKNMQSATRSALTFGHQLSVQVHKIVGLP